MHIVAVHKIESGRLELFDEIWNIAVRHFKGHYAETFGAMTEAYRATFGEDPVALICQYEDLPQVEIA